MSREFYTKQPSEVEVYPVSTGTDIILRRNFEDCTLTSTYTDEEGQTVEQETPAVSCEEAQYRHRGSVTAEDVKSRFDYWWDVATGSTPDEAEDHEAESKGMPTLAERVSVMEDAVGILLEVMLNAE